MEILDNVKMSVVVNALILLSKNTRFSLKCQTTSLTLNHPEAKNTGLKVQKNVLNMEHATVRSFLTPVSFL